MQKIFFLFVSIFSLIFTGVAWAHGHGFSHHDGRYYDDSGRYQGRVDSSGRHYDSSGRYLGREDANGRFYDNTGRYRGQVR